MSLWPTTSRLTARASSWRWGFRRSRSRVPESRLLPREQPGLADLQRALRPLPEPRHRDPCRHLRPSRRVDGRTPDRWPRRGVKQVTADGALFPTIRRFPSVSRTLGEALGSERWPVRAAWAGERELDLARYEHELEMRLDVGLLHAGTPRGAAQRRAPRRAILHLLPRSRTCVYACAPQAGRSCTSQT